ncbi:MAG TPA: hypothetical protein VHG29_06920 [Novosphingobium sp.]|nr:hypothetical protein [Novosphingobium sp.]
MDEPDDGFFPQSAVPILGIAALLFVGGLIWFAPPKVKPPPSPPHKLEGCYSTAGGPDLSFHDDRLIVQQSPPIQIGYSVEYVKGWAFEISRELIYSPAPNGQLTLSLGRNFGMYLFVSREGEVASRLPAFDLFDRESYKVRYEWSGTECGAASKG